MKKNSLNPESQSVSNRIAREKKTIEMMIRMYCSRHHEKEGYLCDECRQLLDYADKRLQGCPFKEDKPTCANCTVHCFKQGMREKIRGVMLYSGPRMIYRHPVLAFRHLIDGRRLLHFGGQFFVQDSFAKQHAAVADIDARSLDQFLNLGMRFTTEAAQREIAGTGHTISR